MKHILIVEDDKEINKLLCKILEENGFMTQSAYTGTDGLEMLRAQSHAQNHAQNHSQSHAQNHRTQSHRTQSHPQNHNAQKYDMVLLDIMLPFKSGDEVLRELRSFSTVPVIMITAKDLTQTKIDLLRLGADDYITKPFDVDEVIARIEATLRRSDSAYTTEGSLSYMDIVMDCNAKRVAVSDKDVALTVTEYAILELLMRNPAKIFSKRNLFESVSGEEYLSDDSTMNVHISNLRQKLREAGKCENYIETVYGMGYRLLKN